MEQRHAEHRQNNPRNAGKPAAPAVPITAFTSQRTNLSSLTQGCRGGRIVVVCLCFFGQYRCFAGASAEFVLSCLFGLCL